MNATLVAVVLSLFSAVAYAAAAVAQERLASRSPGAGVGRMLGAPAWWGSVALNAAAALLHVVALKYGTLTVVQPLGALTLVAAVPMGARVAGRPVLAAEWRGTALTLLGLSALLVSASGSAPDRVLGVPQALAVTATTAVLIGVLGRPGARPGLRHASASGFASGVASALTQTVTVAVTDRSQSLLSVQVIGVAMLVALFAAGGLLLSQTAYRGGLGAPLAVVTLANPVAAAAIGICLLGERLRGGAAGVLLALAGAALASWGVVLLTRVSPPAPLTASGTAPSSGTVPSPVRAPVFAAPDGSFATDVVDGRPAAGVLVPDLGPLAEHDLLASHGLLTRHTLAADHGDGADDDHGSLTDEDHPVAAVLALEAGDAPAEHPVDAASVTAGPLVRTVAGATVPRPLPRRAAQDHVTTS